MSGRSACPECGTILRIRDRTFLGRRVNCPECKTALRIDEQENRNGYVTRRLTAEEINAIEHGHRGTKGSPPKNLHAAPLARSSVRRIIDSPLTAAWLLAFAIMALIAVLMLAPKARFSSIRPVPIGQETQVSTAPATVAGPTEILARIAADQNLEKPIHVADDNHDDPLTGVSALKPDNVDSPLPFHASVEMTKEPATELPPAPAPKTKVITLKEKLAFEWDTYKQSKPISRRDLIEALQEQLGAQIRYDSEELGPTNLDHKVTFELEKTTMEAVIKTVAEAAGWEIRIEEPVLHLKLKQSSSGSDSDVR